MGNVWDNCQTFPSLFPDVKNVLRNFEPHIRAANNFVELMDFEINFPLSKSFQFNLEIYR